MHQTCSALISGLYDLLKTYELWISAAERMWGLQVYGNYQPISSECFLKQKTLFLSRCQEHNKQFPPPYTFSNRSFIMTRKIHRLSRFFTLLA
jgi:hypothetical protein